MRVWMLRIVMVAMLAVGAGSEASAQLNTRAYVANRGASSVTVADVRSGTVLRTISLESPPYDVVATDQAVFVSMPAVNRVAVIDPVRLIVTGAIEVPGGPRDLDRRDQTILETRLYISTDDGLRIYDWTTRTLAPAIAVGAGQARVLEASNANFGSTGQVYVAACDGGNTVRIVTESNGSVGAPAATGAGPCGLMVTSDALYVANTAGNSVTKFTPTLQAPNTVAVAAQPVGFVEAGNAIWVASASGTLTVLDRTTHGITTTHPIGGTPTAIGWAVSFVLGVPYEAIVVTDAAGTLRMFSTAGALLQTVSTGALPGAVAIGDNNPSDPVSISTAGDWNNAPVDWLAMSLDGRFAAFASGATNLVPGDTNGISDVFVRDRLLRRTVRVSVASSGAEATGSATPVNGLAGSYAPSLSADGRYVIFRSLSATLVAGDTNLSEDLFWHDRDVDGDGLFDEPGQIETRRVSIRTDGTQGLCFAMPSTACLAPHIDAVLSQDGRQVAFSTILEFDDEDINPGSDVYVHDVVRRITTRISRRPGQTRSFGDARLPILSANGRVVAFRTSDAGMVGYDTNNVDDVYAVDRDADGNGVFDEAAPAFTHVSLKPGGALYTEGAFPVAVSDDGRYVAYWSHPTLGIYDRSMGHNALVREDSTLLLPYRGQFSPDARHLALLEVGLGQDFVRLDRDTDADGVLDEAGTVALSLPSSIRSDGRGTATDATQRLLFVFSSAHVEGLAVRDLSGPAPPPFDTDGDGLGNTFETRFRLSPTSDAAADGATGDPDGDGRTNAEEQAAGTHPRGFQTRYLAEGATGSFFATRIAVGNPGSTQANVLLRYQTETGQTTSSWMPVPPQSRRFVNVNTVGSLASASFSTVVESDTPVVVDRSMFWSSGFYGSHAETSLAGPSTTWFLAEGATHGAFDLFYLLQNPDPTTPAHVEIRYLRPTGAPLVRTYTVPAARRLTVYVDQVPGLEATDVSAAFTSSVPIIVERAMYYSRPGVPFAGGHGSAAVPAPATQWLLAEGATGRFFDLFVLIANPSSSPADVRLTYLRPSGAPIVRTRTVAANSRVSIFVGDEDPLLTDTPVSTIVESTNAVGIVVERAMWWPASDRWQESHNSPGATTTALRWGFADGEVGGPPFNTQTYFLIANTGASPATVRATLLFDDGTAPATRTYTVPANSRFNVPVGPDFPQAALKGFGALFESIGANPVPIVVERAMYSDAGGVVWAAGTNALGTPLP